MNEERKKKEYKRLKRDIIHKTLTFQWFNPQKIRNYYFVIYVDVIELPSIKFRSKNVNFYVIIGVGEDWKREIITFGRYTERFNWEETLLDLKARGIEFIDIIVTANIKRLNDAVRKIFPNSLHQKSISCLERELIKCVLPKQKSILKNDIKHLFGFHSSYLDSINDFNERLLTFCNTWGISNPNMVRILQKDLNSYTTFYCISYKVRDLIKSTDWVIDLKNKLKRGTKVDTKSDFYKPLNVTEQQIILYTFYEAMGDIEADFLRKPIGRFKFFHRLE